MARVASGLIFAQIGLTAGILSNRLFSAILLVVIPRRSNPAAATVDPARAGATLDEDSAP